MLARATRQSMFGTEQRQRKGQAHARKRFGQRDDVGREAHILEAEEAAGAPAAGLDVVDDQQRAVTLGDLRRCARSHSGEAALRPPSPCTVSTRIAAGASRPLDGSDRR